jgi:hypothetical protein
MILNRDHKTSPRSVLLNAEPIVRAMRCCLWHMACTLGETARIADLKPEVIAAAIYPGGHGPLRYHLMRSISKVRIRSL